MAKGKSLGKSHNHQDRPFSSSSGSYPTYFCELPLLCLELTKFFGMVLYDIVYLVKWPNQTNIYQIPELKELHFANPFINRDLYTDLGLAL